MTHRRPNMHVADHDSPIMQRLRASVLSRHPVTEITDPAEQARIAAEVAQQEAARVPLCVISPLRGGSYSSDPLPMPKIPAPAIVPATPPHPKQEPAPMPPAAPPALATAARLASTSLRRHMEARPSPLRPIDLAELMHLIEPFGRGVRALTQIAHNLLGERPPMTSMGWPLAADALGITLADICADPDWIAAQPCRTLLKPQPPLALPSPAPALPQQIGAYPEDLLDDHHTPDGPLPSLPFDEDANNPDLDITGHITGIRPRDTLTDTIARTQRTPTGGRTASVLDPALELGRALTHAVDAAVAAALRSVEARCAKAEAAAATATAQAQALAAQVEVLSRRLDRLRDVL